MKALLVTDIVKYCIMEQTVAQDKSCASVILSDYIYSKKGVSETAPQMLTQTPWKKGISLNTFKNTYFSRTHIQNTFNEPFPGTQVVFQLQ